MIKNEPKVSLQSQLTGWKEISAYIGKGVRQAQRWEKLGMPVHRVDAMDGVVYAFRAEIDEWRRSAAGLQAEPFSPDPPVLLARVDSDLSRSKRALLYTGAMLVIAVVALAAYRLGGDFPLEISMWSEPTGMQGSSFRFRATGNLPDVDAATRRMWGPDGQAHLLAPVVNRDRDGQFIWVFSTDCQTRPGKHRVALVDDSGGALTATLEFGVTSNSQCQGAVPDIVAETVTVDPANVESGGDLTCRFVLRNQGAYVANPSTTRLRLSPSPMRSSISDIRLGDLAAPALKPGESSTFEFRGKLPAQMSSGVYYLWIVADNNSDNVESFSHNNYARSTAVTVSSAK